MWPCQRNTTGTRHGAAEKNRNVNVGTMFDRNQTSPDIDPMQKIRSRHCRMAMSAPNIWPDKCRMESGFVTFCNKVVSWLPCIVLFWDGRHNKTLNDWPHGKLRVLLSLDTRLHLGEHWGSRGNEWRKQNSLFTLGPVIKCLLTSLGGRIYPRHFRSGARRLWKKFYARTQDNLTPFSQLVRH